MYLYLHENRSAQIRIFLLLYNLHLYTSFRPNTPSTATHAAIRGECQPRAQHDLAGRLGMVPQQSQYRLSFDLHFEIYLANAMRVLTGLPLCCNR
ncbi:MAG: hypothetical protein R3B47_09565 [Bacteroidia bacterium]